MTGQRPGRILRMMGVTIAVCGSLQPADAAEAPANVGGGLVQMLAAGPAALGAFAGRARLDAQGRVQVCVHLDGSRPIGDVALGMEWLGGSLVDQEPGYAGGIVVMMMPLSAIRTAAAMAGVKSIVMAPMPGHDIGAATTQGAAPLQADKVNGLGDLGRGVTVSVLSDSFNTDGQSAADVAAGDLPGPGNPNGFTSPVVVLDDPGTGSDEGRAMAQIISDIAPAARLCFATSNRSDVSFAHNIQALADPHGKCGAQILVDDTYYTNEPVFSEGIIAQAVDAAAAKGVAVFTSAGNFNRWSMQRDLTLVSDAQGRVPRAADPIDLASVPSALTAGGFHNFGTPDAIQISLPYSTPGASLIELQWNDPFDLGKVTTDLNLLVFDEKGKYRADLSGFDDNLKTDQPIEGADLPRNPAFPDPGYRLVIARKTVAPPGHVVRWRLLDLRSRGAPRAFNLPYEPAMFGHKIAPGAIAVGAAYFGDRRAAEGFSSNGPGELDFDTKGVRLATPLLLARPDVLAPDGVVTTVPGFSEFFGTSAAAPHAAGVGALLLAAAGGPGKLTPAQLRATLQSTARPHPSQVNMITAGGGDASGSLQVKVSGLFGDLASQFSVYLQAPPGVSARSLSLDLTKPGLNVSFQSGKAVVAPLGFLASAVQTLPGQTVPLSLSNLELFRFTSGAFRNQTELRFGLPFFIPGLEISELSGTVFAPQTSADPVLLDQGTISVALSNGRTVTAPFHATPPTRDWRPDSGYGFIDALAAYNAVKSRPRG